MPVYDYKCHECSKIFEIIKGINEDIIDLICPGCKSKKVSRNYASISMGKPSNSSACSSCNDGVCGTCSSKR